jgi:urease accessory protein
MLICTKRLSPPLDVPVHLTLSLTAEERTRSRYRLEPPDQMAIALRLPRGTVLADGDFLAAESGEIVQILAKPEPVLTVTAHNSLDLLRAAYHLGNRHVPLEIAPTYLRLSPDSVLRAMLERLDLQVREEVVAFHPETGAYQHSH